MEKHIKFIKVKTNNDRVEFINSAHIQRFWKQDDYIIIELFNGLEIIVIGDMHIESFIEKFYI